LKQRPEEFSNRTEMSIITISRAKIVV
jgi:hypothetical protein